jgi:hypothetical protein
MLYGVGLAAVCLKGNQRLADIGLHVPNALESAAAID